MREGRDAEDDGEGENRKRQSARSQECGEHWSADEASRRGKRPEHGGSQ